MAYYLVLITLLVHCFYVVVDSRNVPNLSSKSMDESEPRHTTEKLNRISQTKTTLLDIEENETGSTKDARIRLKRQSGAARFKDASAMPQLRLLRAFLTLFRNSWAPRDLGGRHPIHYNSVGPVVKWYKFSVADFFFPESDHEAMKI